MESHATVVITLDHGVLFGSSVNCAEFSGRLSEVAQTLDAISRNQLLAGGIGLRERWSLGPVSVRDRPSVCRGGWGALRSLGIGLLVLRLISCFFPRGQSSALRCDWLSPR